MLRRLPLLALPAVLACVAPAQKNKPLVLRTAHGPTAQRVLDLFEAKDPLPALKPGENWLLELDRKGALAIDTDESLITALQIAIRPNLLMETHPRGWTTAVQHMRDLFANTWRDAGLEAVGSLRLFDVLVDFPQQLAQVRLRVNGNLAKPLEDLDVQVWFRAEPGTWLDSFIKTVKPQGLQTVYGVDPRSAATLRVAVAIDGAEEALAPLAGLLVEASAASPEQAAKSAENYWHPFDGSLLVSWNPQAGTILSIAGLRDAGPIRDLYNHPKYLDWMKAQRTTPSGFEVEFTPNALSHRSASLWKSVVRPSGAVASRLPERYLQNEMVSYGGVVRSYLLGMTGYEEERVKQLVDAATDHAFLRNILPNMILARLQFTPAKLFAARADEFDLDSLPESVTIGLGTTGELLFLSVRLR